jgi:hypothetical protein
MSWILSFCKVLLVAAVLATLLWAFVKCAGVC